jgi:hypothetical protein
MIIVGSSAGIPPILNPEGIYAPKPYKSNLTRGLDFFTFPVFSSGGPVGTIAILITAFSSLLYSLTIEFSENGQSYSLITLYLLR